MNVKEYLMQFGKLEAQLNHKTERIERLKEEALCCTGGELGRIRGGGNKYGGSHMERFIAELIDEEAELYDGILECIRLRNEMLKAMEQLETTEYIVVYEMYVKQKTYTDVAEQLDRSYSYVTKKHASALRNLGNILNLN